MTSLEKLWTILEADAIAHDPKQAVFLPSRSHIKVIKDKIHEIQFRKHDVWACPTQETVELIACLNAIAEPSGYRLEEMVGVVEDAGFYQTRVTNLRHTQDGVNRFCIFKNQGFEDKPLDTKFLVQYLAQEFGDDLVIEWDIASDNVALMSPMKGYVCAIVIRSEEISNIYGF